MAHKEEIRSGAMSLGVIIFDDFECFLERFPMLTRRRSGRSGVVLASTFRCFGSFLERFLERDKEEIEVRHGSKSASRGFPGIRTHARLRPSFPGMRQWCLPLRHGRGCGLRVCGSR